MPFSQIVIGAPGAGKSTYCNGMHQFMHAIGRKAVVVNLDPANEDTQYECAVNVTDLITVQDVMDEFGLGPNGALVYCIEWLANNMHLLREALKPYEDQYILFDFPGQAELYTHHASMRKIVRELQAWQYQPVAVHLVDSYLCSDPSNFVAALLMSLSVMCHLELPHVNVLTKVDLFSRNSSAVFGLDFYTEVMDLSYLLRFLDPEVEGGNNDDDEEEEGEEEEEHGDNDYEADDDGEEEDISTANEAGDEKTHASEDEAKGATRKSGDSAMVSNKSKRGGAKSLRGHGGAKKPELTEAVKKFVEGHRRLNEAICEVVTDYSLVNFFPLAITDKFQMHAVLKEIDRGNSYVFADVDMKNVNLAALQQQHEMQQQQQQRLMHPQITERNWRPSASAQGSSSSRGSHATGT